MLKYYVEMICLVGLKNKIKKNTKVFHIRGSCFVALIIWSTMVQTDLKSNLQFKRKFDF
jgi:hypothetical protein